MGNGLFFGSPLGEPKLFQALYVSLGIDNRSVVNCRILRLPVLSADFLQNLSTAVKEFLLKCLQPGLNPDVVYTVRYCLIRCLARNQLLQDRLPLLPEHAAEVLNWLHETFYKAGMTAALFLSAQVMHVHSQKTNRQK